MISSLGSVAVSFYGAIKKSKANQRILRNRELFVPWVAEYYDAGKPDWLVRHANSKVVRDLLPAVLRPDLLPVSGGMALTEWDSVPGGIGLTARFGSAYLGEDAPSMVEAFGEALASAASGFGGKKANMVIAVSEESKTYRPEMDWLASEMGKRGFSIGLADPVELEITDDGVFKDGAKVDLVAFGNCSISMAFP